METTTAIFGVLLGVAFVGLGVVKVIDAKPMRAVREHLGLPVGLFRVVGILELLGGVGVVAGLHEDLPMIGIMAAIGLIGMTIGAGFYHQKAGDSMKGRLPAVAMGSVAIFYIILRVATA